VIIFNPNEREGTNEINKDYNGKEIKKFSTMEKHCLYIWNEIIEKYSLSKEIYIIAHSMGGVCTIKILQEALLHKKNINYIKKIIFTDSVHGDKLASLFKKENLSEFLKQNMIHFIASEKPAGFFLKKFDKTRE
jgi:hypothetical protein